MKLKLIRDLQLYSEKNLIVVEGKRDKEVLEELKIKNVYAIYEVKRLNLKKYREVLILTDRDKKGKKIYKHLYLYFTSEGLIINEQLRKRFFEVFRVIRVEELRTKIKDILHVLEYGELTGPSFLFEDYWDFSKSYRSIFKNR